MGTIFGLSDGNAGLSLPFSAVYMALERRFQVRVPFPSSSQLLTNYARCLGQVVGPVQQ